MKEKIRIVLKECSMVPLGQTSDSWDVLTVQNLMFEPLVRRCCGQIHPALAKGWTISEEGKRWTFYLRDEAKFSDGSICTMDDVHHSLEEMRGAKDAFGMPGPYSRYLAGLEFNVLNEKTLEIISESPNGDIGDFLSEIYIRKDTHAGEAPIGTGAYELAEWAPSEKISLRQVSGKKLPEVYATIEFLIAADARQRLEMLKAGGADAAMDLDQLPNVPFDDTAITWLKAVNTLSVMGFLNAFEKPFNNPKARLALNYAVNVERIIDKLWHGLAIPSATIVSPFHCGFESTLTPIIYHPEKAKALFAEVDMPEELLLRAPAFMPEQAPLIAEMIAEDLRALGIKFRVDIQTNRPEYAREIGRKETGHIALFDSSPHSSYRVLSDKLYSHSGGLWWQGIEDPVLDEQIETAHRETDVTLRQFAYAKALRYLNENPCWLYLYHPVLVCGCSDPALNIEMTHEGLLRFPGTW